MGKFKNEFLERYNFARSHDTSRFGSFIYALPLWLLFAICLGLGWLIGEVATGG